MHPGENVLDIQNQPHPCKYNVKDCIFTDGSKKEPTTDNPNPTAGGGVTCSEAEICFHYDGIKTAHRSETLALLQAVILALKIDPHRHWHVFTDSLVGLHTLITQI